jgi:uncharacterized protein (DUF1501 family)
MTGQPSAALVKDLKQRGMVGSTIVIWTGEFGRLTISRGTDGRDHKRDGFPMWIAGTSDASVWSTEATSDQSASV